MRARCVPKSGKVLKVLTFVTLVVGVILHTWHATQHWKLLNIKRQDGNVASRARHSDDIVISDVGREKGRRLHHSFRERSWERNLLRRSYILLLRETNICKTSDKGVVELFIMIMTKCSEVSLRVTLRQTWLTYTQNNTSRVRYVFMMANDGTGSVPEKVYAEFNKYRDIALYDFKDSYENLTLKTTLALKYAATYCSNARYVMKTDSDVFVNIPPLANYLHFMMTSDVHAYGLMHVNATPIRNSSAINKKWFVSARDYPDQHYPDYLDGMGYVLTMGTVHALTKVFSSVRFFKFEDVYIGMCLKYLDLKLQHSQAFVRSENVLDLCRHQSRGVFAVHGVSEQMARAIWILNCTGMMKTAERKPAGLRHMWIKHVKQ